MRGNSILIVMAAFLMFVIFSAARIGAADLLFGYARNEMAAWSSGSIRPDRSALDQLSHVLDVARQIAPDNPSLHQDMARLTLVRSGMPGNSETARSTMLRDGLALIRQTLALRPVSPYSWAILLRIKHELGEYDAEFRLSLERTVTLGPWEPELQPLVAEVGLSAWAVLPRAEREMVRENFLRGWKRQAATMIFIAQSHSNDCIGENTGCQP